MKSRALYAGLAGMVVLVWLGLLGSRPLFNPDEGRYAEIPREMLERGDWVIPHLNGLDYIEKPPLQYWATALSYSVFGVNNFSARLYTALCALGTVLLMAFLARRLWTVEAAWRTAAVLGGMMLFLILLLWMLMLMMLVRVRWKWARLLSIEIACGPLDCSSISIRPRQGSK